MRKNLKKLVSYYKPYKGLFLFDLFFAIMGAVITLIIPLIVRYITNEVIYMEISEATKTIAVLGLVMVGLVLLEMGCNYFMEFYGHMMGTYMEADMRKDIFGHTELWL